MIPESTGVTSMDKAKRVIEQIEDELERLSEVDDAEVVIAGNKAAVGLEFDDQYKAGVDDRLRKIVKERIDSVISGISTVAVTADKGIMDAIEATIADRAANPKPGSYTNYLLDKGAEKICKKVGEEATEAVIAAMKNAADGLAGEVADLMYHLAVLLHAQGVEWRDVWEVLRKRHT